MIAVSAALLLAICSPVSMASMQAQDVRSGAFEEKPKWCHSQDCPQFELLQTKDDIQLRRYAAGNWVTVNTTGTWDEAYADGQKALSEYKSGKNDAEVKLSNTVPTLTIMYGTDAKTVKASFTISYFVPFNQQNNVPTPTREGVSVYAAEEQDIWVQSFGGFASESDSVTMAYALFDNLKAQGQKVQTDAFGVAIYDQPIQLVSRHNEIWVWGEAKPSRAQ